VLLVGYMRIVSVVFTDHFFNRCLNVHPSLLPEFAGGMDLEVHNAVLAAKRSVSGSARSTLSLRSSMEGQSGAETV
jgi:folate-dependent phosphoribosylglycinamide formyltransferase PurN